jgi:hypothetical protein
LLEGREEKAPLVGGAKASHKKSLDSISLDDVDSFKKFEDDKEIQDGEYKEEVVEKKDGDIKIDNHQEKKRGFLGAMASAVVKRLSFGEARTAWGEYKKAKQEARKQSEIIETAKNGDELILALKTGLFGNLPSETERQLEEYIESEKREGVGIEKIKKELREVVGILEEAQGEKEKAADEAKLRFDQMKKDEQIALAETFIEGLKSSGT